MEDYAFELEERSALPLSLNQYQERAMSTCMPSSENFSYMMLNLVGEVGEFASKVAKAIRKQYISINDKHDDTNEYGEPQPNIRTFVQNYDDCDTEARIEQRANTLHSLNTELKKEAGDIIWQVAGLCTVMGWKLEDVAQQNLEKLASRQERNVIDGNGDNR